MCVSVCCAYIYIYKELFACVYFLCNIKKSPPQKKYFYQRVLFTQWKISKIKVHILFKNEIWQECSEVLVISSVTLME